MMTTGKNAWRVLGAGMILAVMAGCSPFDDGETRLYVSPKGDDAAAGTRGCPFRTLERAQAAARQAVRTAKDGRRVRVVVMDGTYGRATPLHFTAEDSGVTWSAENRTKAVISGAVDLDWRKPTAQEIPALVPAASRAKLLVADIPGTNAIPGFFAGFSQKPDASLVFYQDGVRMNPARDPNADDKNPFLRFERACGKGRFDPDDPKGERGLPLLYDDGLISLKPSDDPFLEKWAKEPDLWAFGYWRLHWAELQCKVLQVLPKERKMQVDVKKSAYGIDPDGHGDQRFYVLNAYSGLDRPGEYVLDRTNRRVWAIPLENAKEPPRYAMGSTLLTGEKASDLAFEGFVFELALQDGLVFRNTTNLAVRASVVRCVGNKGIQVLGGRGARIDGCDVYDLGNTAIVVEGGNIPTLTPGDHVIENCHVHHHGRISTSSPGIQLIGCGNRLQRSLVHHTDSQAVTFKGSEHYIGYNVMHDLCEHNWDAGGIYGYMCNLHERGTVIEYNVVHMTGDQPRFKSEIMAIYLDAFTSGCTVRGNIVSRSRRGIFANGGMENRYVGNLVMNCPVGIYQFCLGPEKGDKNQFDRFRNITTDPLRRGLALYTNALWKARYPNLTRVLDIADPYDAIKARGNVMTNNTLIACGEVNFKHNELNLNRDNVECGFDRFDPGFVDYANFDWRFRPDSPLKDRFDNRFDRMGLYASEWRVTPPVKHGPKMQRPRPLVGEWEWASPQVEIVGAGAVSSLTNCTSAATNVVATFGVNQRWSDEKTFSFTPQEDRTATIWFGGSYGGEKIFVDAVRAEGTDLKDGGFEAGYEKDGGPWRHLTALHDPLYSNQFPPYGIVGAMPQNDVADACRPLEGKRQALVAAEQRVGQTIHLKKGVRVTIGFRYYVYYPYDEKYGTLD